MARNAVFFAATVFGCAQQANRRLLAGKLVLLGLALLLAAPMPFSPVHFTSRIPENCENAKCTFFSAMGLGHARQAAGLTLTSKSGLPELALLVSD